MLDGGVFAAINTTFKFVEFCYALGDVPSESLVFIRLIQRVRDDLDECLRLSCLLVIQQHLESDPDQKDYINGTIYDTKVALAGIGKWVESVRTEEEQRGELSLHTRFEWILRHQYKLQSRQVGLDTCHKSLLQAMSQLTLVLHAASLTGGHNGLPSYVEATKDKDGVASVDAKRVDAKVADPTALPDDELIGFLAVRNRRIRPGRGKTMYVSTIEIPIPEDNEWRPVPQNSEQPFAPHMEQPSICLSPEAVPDSTQSLLHPNAAELGYDPTRPSTSASNMTGSTYFEEPATPARLRSFSSSSSQASIAFTPPFEFRSPGADGSLILSGPPTPFFLPERPRSTYNTYPPQHQASSSLSELSQFGMRSQSASRPYQTHHDNLSVGSGFSDFSSNSPTYSTQHQNFSSVNGFSELPAQSPRSAHSYSDLAPRSNQFYPWNHDPGANAPEVVQTPQTVTPKYIAYSPPEPPEPMPDYSIPEVVPVEHEGHRESLPEVITQYSGDAYAYPRGPLNADLEVAAGLEVAPQPQQPPPPPKGLTQAQERRAKERARLNLIAGD